MAQRKPMYQAMQLRELQLKEESHYSMSSIRKWQTGNSPRTLGTPIP